MRFLLSLLACAEPEHRPTADAGTPIIPDLGSLYDPRLAGCSASQDLEDGSYQWDWEFDATGHATSEHRTSDDGTYTVVSRQLTWEDDCIVEDATTTVVDDVAETYTVSAVCDEHGNPTQLQYTLDGELVETHTLTNEYSSQELLSRRTGTAESITGDVTDLAESYAWADGWIVQRTYTTESGDVRFTSYTEATADAVGQALESSTRVCAEWGEEDCGTAAESAFTYDSEGHVVSAEGAEKWFSADEDGVLSTDDARSWSATYTPGSGYVPAESAYTYDEADLERWVYTTACD